MITNLCMTFPMDAALFVVLQLRSISRNVQTIAINSGNAAAFSVQYLANVVLLR